MKYFLSFLALAGFTASSFAQSNPYETSIYGNDGSGVYRVYWVPLPSNGAALVYDSTGNKFIALTLATVAYSNDYNDLSNKPVIGSPSYNFAVSAKTIQTVAAAANGFQVSSTRNSWVTYSVTITTATTVLGTANSSGYVVLEIAATNSTTASDWKEVGRMSSGQNTAITVAVGTITQTGGGSLSGMVPSGYYTRLRSVIVADTPTFAYNSGEEVLM